MTAEDLLRAGQLADALAALQNRVRSNPSDSSLRVFLFQLLAVMGDWSRAQNQLKVAGELDAGTLAMVQTYRTALECEALRAQVFAGRHTPVVLGEPGDWLALLVQALKLDADGHAEAAQDLRAQAFEAAPTSAGQVNQRPFSWFADADPRLGPVLEVMVNGRYAWLPMHNIQQLRTDAPADLRDLVWLPTELTLSNGGNMVALIPSRYPGSEASADDAVRLARKTEWDEQGLPSGQRLFADDTGDTALFELRELQFGTEPATP